MMKVKGMRDSAAVMNRFFGNVYDLIANCFLGGGPKISRNPHKTVNVGTKKEKRKRGRDVTFQTKHTSPWKKTELKIQVKKKMDIPGVDCRRDPGVSMEKQVRYRRIWDLV